MEDKSEDESEDESVDKAFRPQTSSAAARGPALTTARFPSTLTWRGGDRGHHDVDIMTLSAGVSSRRAHTTRRAPRPATIAVLLAVAVLGAGTACTAAQHTISGTVRGTDDRPREGCAIVVGVISGGPVPEIALLSGQDGTYAWTLPAGEYTLTAHCPSGASGEMTVDATLANVDAADIVVEGDGLARDQREEQRQGPAQGTASATNAGNP